MRPASTPATGRWRRPRIDKGSGWGPMPSPTKAAQVRESPTSSAWARITACTTNRETVLTEVPAAGSHWVVVFTSPPAAVSWGPQPAGHLRSGPGSWHVPQNSARVALKQIRPEMAGDPRRRKRFRREARAVAQLDHPAIVSIYDLLATPEGDWLVLQYVEGPSLAQRLHHGPLPHAQVSAVAADVLGARFVPGDRLDEQPVLGKRRADLEGDRCLLVSSPTHVRFDSAPPRRDRDRACPDQDCFSGWGGTGEATLSKWARRCRRHRACRAALRPASTPAPVEN